MTVTPEDEARAAGIDVDALQEASDAARVAGCEFAELVAWWEAVNSHPWPPLNPGGG